MYEFKPFKYSSHEKIISLTPRNTKVLDVGCASGYIAFRLKKKGCYVVGTDIDKKYLEEAKKYCDEVFLLDISKDKIKGKFDVIILGDIIEHIANSGGVLEKLRNNLNENGRIIVSVPNIVNIYPRIKILFGRFDYEEKGIFDKTHLRFFTIKTLKRLIKNKKYQITSMHFTPLPIYLILPNAPKTILNLLSSLLNLLANFWPNLFAYQIIIKANKLKNEN